MGATLSYSAPQLAAYAAIGSYEDVSIIISNNGAWTLSAVALQKGALFSLQGMAMSSNGGGTWTAVSLPVSIGQGNLLQITVRYSPQSTPSNGLPDTDMLLLTDDASYPKSQQGIPLYGTGLHAPNQITLPVVYNTAAGTIKAYLFVDYTLPALTPPATVRIISIGKVLTQLDSLAGALQPETLDVTFAEGYSTYYPEGFFYKVINGYQKDVEIMLTLMEGTNETYLFRGRIRKDRTTWDEHYLNNATDSYPPGTAPTDWVRGVKIQAISSLDILKNIPVSDVLNESLAHKVVTDSLLNYYGVSFATIIAVMIQLAYGASFDTSLVVNDSNDFYLVDSVGVAQGWTDCLVHAQWDNSGIWEWRILFDPLSANGWASRFSSAYDLLANIAYTFGCIPRYTFGDGTGLISGTPSNNRPRIEFANRGHAGNVSANVAMTGGYTETKSTSNSPLQPHSIRIADIEGNAPNYQGLQAVPPPYYYAFNGIFNAGWMPAAQSFDIDRVVDLWINNMLSPDNDGRPIVGPTNGNPTNYIQGVKVWNYHLGAYETFLNARFTLTDNILACYLCYYLMNRFAPGRMQYTRTYGSLQSNNGTTTSQVNTKLLMGTTIHDGVQSRNFYATSVEKDIQNDRATVVWVEE